MELDRSIMELYKAPLSKDVTEWPFIKNVLLLTRGAEWPFRCLDDKDEDEDLPPVSHVDEGEGGVEGGHKDVGEGQVE